MATTFRSRERALTVKRLGAMTVFAALVLTLADPLSPAGHAVSVTYQAANESEYRESLTACEELAKWSTCTIEITASFELSGEDPMFSGPAFLVIEGSGEAVVVQPAPSESLRFLDAANTIPATIRNLTVQGFSSEGHGGAVRTQHGLRVYDSTFANNSSGGSGGAIYASGVEIEGSEFRDNSAVGSGGAITSNENSSLSFSYFHGNTAGGSGGAYMSSWETSVVLSTFANNTAEARGGALHINGITAQIYASTFTGNHGHQGGAAFLWADSEIVASTFAFNSASEGGGVYHQPDWEQQDYGAFIYSTFLDNQATVGSQLVSFGSTYLDGVALSSGGGGASNCFVNPYSYGFGTWNSWSDDSSCFGSEGYNNRLGTDAKLGDLGLNNWFIPSLEPLPGSPLRDAIPRDDVLCEPWGTVDKRSVERPQGVGGCDIGAIEVYPGAYFTDVLGSHPFFTEVTWLTDMGIAEGYSNGTFKPTSPVSRQAMAAFLYRYEGSPWVALGQATFTDVPTSHPFFREIEWLAAQGVTTGYGDGTFRPGAGVSRQAMAAFLHRYVEEPDSAESGSGFKDVPSDHPFAVEISWLASTGITTGYSDGTFRPARTVSRQAMAAFLERLHAVSPIDWYPEDASPGHDAPGAVTGDSGVTTEDLQELMEQWQDVVDKGREARGL